MSLLLVPAKDGDKHGAPFAAEKFFNQMEIYPGVHPQIRRFPGDAIT